MRCESKSPHNGIQCGLPAGHSGNHSTGLAHRTWLNENRTQLDWKKIIPSKDYNEDILDALRSKK